MSDLSDLHTRVAILEQIAKDTKEGLAGLRSDGRDWRSDVRGELRDLRSEMRDVRGDMQTSFRWLLGIMLGMGGGLLAAMAKGFHWL